MAVIASFSLAGRRLGWMGSPFQQGRWSFAAHEPVRQGLLAVCEVISEPVWAVNRSIGTSQLGQLAGR